MKIELDVSTKNECTASPYWLIIDPRQMMSPDCHIVAGMITGPFFSREEADLHLKVKRHRFSKRAVVYCHSGCDAYQYDSAYRNSERKQQEPTQ